MKKLTDTWKQQKHAPRNHSVKSSHPPRNGSSGVKRRLGQHAVGPRAQDPSILRRKDAHVPSGLPTPGGRRSSPRLRGRNSEVSPEGNKTPTSPANSSFASDIDDELLKRVEKLEADFEQERHKEATVVQNSPRSAINPSARTSSKSTNAFVPFRPASNSDVATLNGSGNGTSSTEPSNSKIGKNGGIHQIPGNGTIGRNVNIGSRGNSAILPGVRGKGQTFVQSFTSNTSNESRKDVTGEVLCPDSQSPDSEIVAQSKRVIGRGPSEAKQRESDERKDPEEEMEENSQGFDTTVLSVHDPSTPVPAPQAGSQDHQQSPISPPPPSTQDSLRLSSWGLPVAVLNQYELMGVEEMFLWQAQCLRQGRVLQGGNLIYSAPTSAGKTLVAEILVLKKVLESKKKGLIILPFVSVSREKMFYLQNLLQDTAVRVDGFMGSHSPPGGFKSVDVAVCTIEKANSLINRMLEEKSLDQLGIIVVDELHMVGDSHRGYLLELLLTKIKYVTSGDTNSSPVQIVGMSATLPNLDLLARWLDADLYSTDFRPVPLTEFVKMGPALYDSQMNHVRDCTLTYDVRNDDDQVFSLCLETMAAGCAVLIFCPTKNWCEKLAENMARELSRLRGVIPIKSTGFVKASEFLTLDINHESLQDIMEQLKRTPAGLDSTLKRTIPCAVAYHHAGLTFDERDIVEGGFRQGHIRILVATSTLSSGVNLPARRVIIRSIMFNRRVIDPLCYKQMSGRAGRKGVDTEGESVLICKPNEHEKARTLISSELPPVKSCLIQREGDELSNSMKRAILEVIASGVASSPADVQRYSSSTLLAASLSSEDEAEGSGTSSAIDACINFLREQEFIRLHKDETGEAYLPTQLGSATLASALSPHEAQAVFTELQRARKSFVLENELHILYQVTPIYDNIQPDWYQFLHFWESLSTDRRRVAELVGVEERFLIRAAKGNIPTHTPRQVHLLGVHRRFHVALILEELVNETPLGQVARKYGCTKGQLQSLQQSAATFAGMVTIFCSKLGWYSLELLLGQFQSRLDFGVQRELVDLVRISLLNGQRARLLYDSGYTNTTTLATASPKEVETVLRNAVPFKSARQAVDEKEFEAAERRAARCIWASGKKGLTEAEAAELIVMEAKYIVQSELGSVGIEWNPQDTKKEKANLGTSGGKRDGKRKSVDAGRSGQSISKEGRTSDKPKAMGQDDTNGNKLPVEGPTPAKRNVKGHTSVEESVGRTSKQPETEESKTQQSKVGTSLATGALGQSGDPKDSRTRNPDVDVPLKERLDSLPRKNSGLKRKGASVTERSKVDPGTSSKCQQLQLEQNSKEVENINDGTTLRNANRDNNRRDESERVNGIEKQVPQDNTLRGQTGADDAKSDHQMVVDGVGNRDTSDLPEMRCGNQNLTRAKKGNQFMKADTRGSGGVIEISSSGQHGNGQSNAAESKVLGGNAGKAQFLRSNGVKGRTDSSNDEERSDVLKKCREVSSKHHQNEFIAANGPEISQGGSKKGHFSVSEEVGEMTLKGSVTSEPKQMSDVKESKITDAIIGTQKCNSEKEGEAVPGSLSRHNSNTACPEDQIPGEQRAKKYTFQEGCDISTTRKKRGKPHGMCTATSKEEEFKRFIKVDENQKNPRHDTRSKQERIELSPIVMNEVATASNGVSPELFQGSEEMDGEGDTDVVERVVSGKQVDDHKTDGAASDQEEYSLLFSPVDSCLEDFMENYDSQQEMIAVSASPDLISKTARSGPKKRGQKGTRLGYSDSGVAMSKSGISETNGSGCHAEEIGAVSNVGDTMPSKSTRECLKKKSINLSRKHSDYGSVGSDTERGNTRDKTGAPFQKYSHPEPKRNEGDYSKLEAAGTRGTVQSFQKHVSSKAGKNEVGFGMLKMDVLEPMKQETRRSRRGSEARMLPGNIQQKKSCADTEAVPERSETREKHPNSDEEVHADREPRSATNDDNRADVQCSPSHIGKDILESSRDCLSPGTLALLDFLVDGEEEDDVTFTAIKPQEKDEAVSPDLFSEDPDLDSDITAAQDGRNLCGIDVGPVRSRIPDGSETGNQLKNSLCDIDFSSMRSRVPDGSERCDQLRKGSKSRTTWNGLQGDNAKQTHPTKFIPARGGANQAIVSPDTVGNFKRNRRKRRSDEDIPSDSSTKPKQWRPSGQSHDRTKVTPRGGKSLGSSDGRALDRKSRTPASRVRTNRKMKTPVKSKTPLAFLGSGGERSSSRKSKQTARRKSRLSFSSSEKEARVSSFRSKTPILDDLETASSDGDDVLDMALDSQGLEVSLDSQGMDIALDSEGLDVDLELSQIASSFPTARLEGQGHKAEELDEQIVEFDSESQTGSPERVTGQHGVSIVESPTVPSTPNTFSIIDVCANRDLFEMFFSEWKRKKRYAISLGCENYEMPVEGGGIGGNYKKGGARRDVRVDGFPIERNNLLVTGLAVSWGAKDAYYISLQEENDKADLDGTLAAPPNDSTVPVCRRVEELTSVLEMISVKRGSRQKSEVTKLAFDIKEQIKILAQVFGCVCPEPIEDPKVAHWLLDPSAKEKNLHGVVAQFCPDQTGVLESIGGGIGLSSLGLSPRNPGSARIRACAEAVVLLDLMDALKKELEEKQIIAAFKEVEMPSIMTLAHVEMNGLGFNPEECETQKVFMQSKLTALEEQAYRLAGRGFSLTSLEDIAQVLYMELQIPPNGDATSRVTLPARRTLGGRGRGRMPKQFSTSKEALEKIKHLHPLPGLILEWRKMSMSLTKVVFPLQKEKVFIKKLGMDRILTEYQTHTATGRVATMEPNIQGIPKDFEISLPSVIGESPPQGIGAVAVGPGTSSRKGPKRNPRRASVQCKMGPDEAGSDRQELKTAVSLRHAFCPFPGGVLLAADYSQLELRILAHLSKDPKLTRILNSDGDVFRQIAAQWKGTEEDQITDKQRQEAKQICYGMVYGIGARALGDQLEISEEDAACFMETFRDQYKGMKTFIKQTVDGCRAAGYVETIAGRRRYLPAISHSNMGARNHAERQAVNTTIQGSAADLVKTAMVRLQREFAAAFPATRVSHTHRDKSDLGSRSQLATRQSELPQGSPRGAYLVLQLHDELIYEVHREDVETAIHLVRTVMESAMKLTVRLPVKIKTGQTWGSLKEV